MVSTKRMITQQRKRYTDSQPNQPIFFSSLPFAIDGWYLFLLCVGRWSSTFVENRTMWDSFLRNADLCLHVILPQLPLRSLRLWKVTMFENEKNVKLRVTIGWRSNRLSFRSLFAENITAPWEKNSFDTLPEVRCPILRNYSSRADWSILDRLIWHKLSFTEMHFTFNFSADTLLRVQSITEKEIVRRHCLAALLASSSYCGSLRAFRWPAAEVKLLKEERKLVCI